MGAQRRFALVWSAAVLAFVAGCGVAGTASVGTILPVSSTATASATRPAPPTTTRSTAPTTVTVTATVSTPAETQDNSVQVAPADFTAFRDLNFAARWNDSSTDPKFVPECNALSDTYPYCWSVQVWNGNVACPTGVTVHVDMYDGKAGANGPKVGEDFGISLAKNIQPYSTTRVLIFTATTFPSGGANAAITSIECAL
jgi:hypothetical protein